MAISENPSSASIPWLGDYLADAIVRRLCARVGCTTCGAMEFRQGLYSRAARAVGLPADARKNERILEELITQLTLLSPTTADQHEWFDAVSLIFCEILVRGWRTHRRACVPTHARRNVGQLRSLQNAGTPSPANGATKAMRDCQLPGSHSVPTRREAEVAATEARRTSCREEGTGSSLV